MNNQENIQNMGDKPNNMPKYIARMGNNLLCTPINDMDTHKMCVDIIVKIIDNVEKKCQEISFSFAKYQAHKRNADYMAALDNDIEERYGVDVMNNEGNMQYSDDYSAIIETYAKEHEERLKVVEKEDLSHRYNANVVYDMTGIDCINRQNFLIVTQPGTIIPEIIKKSYEFDMKLLELIRVKLDNPNFEEHRSRVPELRAVHDEMVKRGPNEYAFVMGWYGERGQLFGRLLRTIFTRNNKYLMYTSNSSADANFEMKLWFDTF